MDKVHGELRGRLSRFLEILPRAQALEVFTRLHADAGGVAAYNKASRVRLHFTSKGLCYDLMTKADAQQFATPGMSLADPSAQLLDPGDVLVDSMLASRDNVSMEICVRRWQLALVCFKHRPTYLYLVCN
eukprot:CAMPEP_0196571030 /NCGR_PEP_ID=MMETSP1081-20130531/1215_1 /TAXON_ID=36882 /ORGANISM="Pyramimonas amylifera, Strain CCMP720" /LENGTH=129 /DNA_ID=CAMNT_0041887789 /DNA_START=478 /DNA_END=867 /DNA_ORIENTATION=+